VALGPYRRDLLTSYARWVNDVEVRHTLSHLGVATPETEAKLLDDFEEKMAKRPPEAAHFTIYDRADDAPVGGCGLFEVSWRNGTCAFGIFLGERRGTGLGSGAARLALDYAFTVWGLHNVWLACLASNERAIAAYRRAGFREVGLRRASVLALGERRDQLYMDAVASEFSGSVLLPRES